MTLLFTDSVRSAMTSLTSTELKARSTHLVDFIHPVAGEFKDQFTGLDCGCHDGGVQRAALKCPNTLLALSARFKTKQRPPVLRFRQLAISVQEGDHQRSTLAQMGAASSLSDTEAGSRCAWSIYT